MTCHLHKSFQIISTLQKKPFASTADIESRVVPELTPEMKAIFDKYKNQLVALKPAPEVCFQDALCVI